MPSTPMFSLRSNNLNLNSRCSPWYPHDDIKDELISLGFIPPRQPSNSNEAFVNSFLIKLRKVGSFEEMYSMTTFIYLVYVLHVKTFDHHSPSQSFKC